jgi:hypothetical protein
MKHCSKCGEEKPLSEFYRNSRARDGRKYECKLCSRLYDRARRHADPEGARAKVRAYRARNPNWRRRPPRGEREDAHLAVFRAVRSGKLRRDVCAICGADHAQAHHEDYGRPLDVVWLCPVHHQELHNGYYSLLKGGSGASSGFNSASSAPR